MNDSEIWDSFRKSQHDAELGNVIDQIGEVCKEYTLMDIIWACEKISSGLRLHVKPYEALETLKQNEVDALNIFVRCVEITAESHMLKTGKLEGAHYAAMKQLQKMINEKMKSKG